MFIIAFYFRPDLFVHIPAWGRSHTLPCFKQSLCDVALSSLRVAAPSHAGTATAPDTSAACSLVGTSQTLCTAPPPPLLLPRDKSPAPGVSLAQRVGPLGEQAPGEEARGLAGWRLAPTSPVRHQVIPASGSQPTPIGLGVKKNEAYVPARSSLRTLRKSND